MAYYVRYGSNRRSTRADQGYSLIETILVVIILGILATVALGSLRSADNTARTARTRAAMDKLAFAIAGNPELVSGGGRTDFGYVGDIGALPPNLTALVTNPGYATWSGPYLDNQFLLNGTATATFKDAWGIAYSYSGGTAIQSHGSGTTLSRTVTPSIGDLLYNRLNLTLLDFDEHPPGATLKDSVLISLTIPNGSGSTTTRSTTPHRDGSAAIDSIPIGRHHLRVINFPTNDTLNRIVTIEPGESTYLRMTFPADLW
jgi:prepilin-type N-terminal cleavage/methylation domain-containing protein